MRGVRGMTAQEIGLYTMLLCRMYEESGPIENHTLRLATYSGMRASTFEKTLEKLVHLGKISRANGMLFNDRAEAEISSRADDLKIASKAGKVSSEKRQRNQAISSTPVQRPFNDTDTDTDTEKKDPPTPQGGREGKVSNFRKRSGSTYRQTMDAALEILRKQDEERERLGT